MYIYVDRNTHDLRLRAIHSVEREALMRFERRFHRAAPYETSSTFIYIHIQIYTSLYIYICIYMFTCFYIYIYIYVYKDAYGYIVGMYIYTVWGIGAVHSVERESLMMFDMRLHRAILCHTVATFPIPSMYIYIYTYSYSHIYTYIYIHTCIYMYIYIHINMSMHIRVHMHMV